MKRKKGKELINDVSEEKAYRYLERWMKKTRRKGVKEERFEKIKRMERGRE